MGVRCVARDWLGFNPRAREDATDQVLEAMYSLFSFNPRAREDATWIWIAWCCRYATFQSTRP
ncbi:hypothetical protein XTPLMG728_1272 [Xanthomonas translucens pv. poae]|uniref:Uncharacterized protein n=1 Tax=Xanthomonas graminis pv. poae TaxID=227946 RepID=A0A0K2ZNS1_9XANT|nr:hypothetical protein XTPLMG728_1272 [Xanthomonas translucens pv. poae]